MDDAPLLPSSAGGPLTQTVGWLERDAAAVAEWLSESLGPEWRVRAVDWTSLSDAARHLPRTPEISRRAVVPVESWSLLLTDGPLGTYERRRKRDRFTRDLLYEYLRALGVPIDHEPRWREAVVIERGSSRRARLLKRMPLTRAAGFGRMTKSSA